jgi:GDP-L-fucose synthase
VFLAAARVGGINANDTLPVDFLERNLRIAANVIGAAHESRPRNSFFSARHASIRVTATQPIAEEALLTGPLEPTNQW